METFYTKKEIAKLLRVSEPTIDRWRREDGLPSLKAKRRVLFQLSAVETWLSEQIFLGRK